MLIIQLDFDQTLPLTPVSSFRPLDTVTIDTTTSAGQPAVTNQVHNQAITNLNVTTTNQSMVKTSTNQDASGCPINHEWMWFRMKSHSGCSLGPARMEYWSTALVMHQELGGMPLWIKWLNYHNVSIEFDSEVDVGWVAQQLLRMEQWMGASCNLKCAPCSDEEGLQQFREGNG